MRVKGRTKQTKSEDKLREREDDEYDESIHEVDKILESKVHGKVVKYLIKWKGYTDDFNTWEPKAKTTRQGTPYWLSLVISTPFLAMTRCLCRLVPVYWIKDIHLELGPIIDKLLSMGMQTIDCNAGIFRGATATPMGTITANGHGRLNALGVTSRECENELIHCPTNLDKGIVTLKQILSTNKDSRIDDILSKYGTSEEIRIAQEHVPEIVMCDDGTAMKLTCEKYLKAQTDEHSKSPGGYFYPASCFNHIYRTTIPKMAMRDATNLPGILADIKILGLFGDYRYRPVVWKTISQHWDEDLNEPEFRQRFERNHIDFNDNFPFGVFGYGLSNTNQALERIQEELNKQMAIHRRIARQLAGLPALEKADELPIPVVEGLALVQNGLLPAWSSDYEDLHNDETFFDLMPAYDNVAIKGYKSWAADPYTVRIASGLYASQQLTIGGKTNVVITAARINELLETYHRPILAGEFTGQISYSILQEIAKTPITSSDACFPCEQWCANGSCQKTLGVRYLTGDKTASFTDNGEPDVLYNNPHGPRKKARRSQIFQGVKAQLTPLNEKERKTLEERKAELRTEIKENPSSFRGNIQSKCPYCNKIFQSDRGLKIHISKKHPKQPEGAQQPQNYRREVSTTEIAVTPLLKKHLQPNSRVNATPAFQWINLILILI